MSYHGGKDYAISAIVIGGILEVCGGGYGFISFASGWLAAFAGIGVALLGGLFLFIGIYDLDREFETEENWSFYEYRRKARFHALRNVFLILGWVGVVCFLMVAVHLASEFSWGGLIRAAVCALLTAASMTAGIVFKKKYERL